MALILARKSKRKREKFGLGGERRPRGNDIFERAGQFDRPCRRGYSSVSGPALGEGRSRISILTQRCVERSKRNGPSGHEARSFSLPLPQAFP